MVVLVINLKAFLVYQVTFLIEKIVSNTAAKPI